MGHIPLIFICIFACDPSYHGVLFTDLNMI